MPISKDARVFLTFIFKSHYWNIQYWWKFRFDELYWFYSVMDGYINSCDRFSTEFFSKRGCFKLLSISFRPFCIYNEFLEIRRHIRVVILEPSWSIKVEQFLKTNWCGEKLVLFKRSMLKAIVDFFRLHLNHHYFLQISRQIEQSAYKQRCSCIFDIYF